MRRLNGAMNAACGPTDSTCVVMEEVAALGWNHEDFFDEGHFTAQGHDRLARFLEPRLRLIATRRGATDELIAQHRPGPTIPPSSGKSNVLSSAGAFRLGARRPTRW
jgi:hypothetical protein